MTAAKLRESLDHRAELQQRYREYHLWVSDAGSKYATRTGKDSHWPKSVMTLAADTWHDLETMLDEQSASPEGPSWAI